MRHYGGLGHNITTVVLKACLWLAYIVLRILLPKNNTIPQSDSIGVEPIPEKPISSLALATALDPKSPVKKLVDLVDNESYVIRRALVRNPSLPREHLETLREDLDNRVRQEIGKIYPELDPLNKN